MKVCFVGSGSIGTRHIRNLYNIMKEREQNLDIHLLRSTNKELKNEIKGLVDKECYRITDLDEYYDAIFITNPTNNHYDSLLQLQNYSNCFFIEKPVFDKMDYDLSKIREDKQYYVACPLRYTSVLKRAKELLAKEEVISVRAICSSYLPEWRKGVDYRNVYSAHKNQGGGVRIDLIHEWDYLIDLFGFPKSLRSVTGKYSNLEIDSEDLAIYIAEYKDKLIELHLDYFGRESKREMNVFTNRASFKIDILNNFIKKNGEIIEKFQEDANDKYINEMVYFLEIMEGKKSNNDIRHALKVMSVSIENGE